MGVFKISNIDVQVGTESLVSNVMLNIADNEAVLITGDENSGKEHLVKALIGQLPISSGSISMDAEELQGLPAHQRKIIRIGEDWGLFPHLSVRANIEFGLKFLKLKKDEIADISEKLMRKIGLFQKQKQFPGSLNTKEKLRLVFARAIAINANLIILQNPFLRFDITERKELIDLVKDLQESFKFPLLYLSDHPLDAMGICEKMVVLKNGFLEQSGSTKEIYENPSSTLIAQLTGEINILKAQVVMGGDFYMFSTKLGGLNLKPREKLRVETEVEILIRPEHTKVVPLGKTEEARNVFSGKINKIRYMSGFQFCEVKTEGDLLFLSVQNSEHGFQIGDDIDVILLRDEYPIMKK
jgi:iron(III) transport system ATP-binding protein